MSNKCISLPIGTPWLLASASASPRPLCCLSPPAGMISLCVLGSSHRPYLMGRHSHLHVNHANDPRVGAPCRTLRRQLLARHTRLRLARVFTAAATPLPLCGSSNVPHYLRPPPISRGMPYFLLPRLIPAATIDGGAS